MLIKVKVFPGAKKQEVIKKAPNSFEVFVKEKPEQGRANQRLKQVLASYFNLSSGKIRLIKGAKQRNKIFHLAVS